MKKIKVVDKLKSSNLLSSVKGEILYQYILAQLDQMNSITLDFSDYEYISSTFLNSTFGKLLVSKNWTKEQFFDMIKVIGLSDDDMSNLMLSVQNALFKNDLLLKGQNIEDVYLSNLSY